MDNTEKNKNIGSEFDDFLKEEEIFDEVDAEAQQRVQKWLEDTNSKSKDTK